VNLFEETNFTDCDKPFVFENPTVLENVSVFENVLDFEKAAVFGKVFDLVKAREAVNGEVVSMACQRHPNVV
jgi:hypothetical protein